MTVNEAIAEIESQLVGGGLSAATDNSAPNAYSVEIERDEITLNSLAGDRLHTMSYTITTMLPDIAKGLDSLEEIGKRAQAVLSTMSRGKFMDNKPVGADWEQVEKDVIVRVMFQAEFVNDNAN